MLARLLAAAVCLLPLAAFAQTLAPDNGAFVWRDGSEFIRFDKGRWTAGIDGARSLSWHVFLWHDDWKYETITGGTIEAGPELQPDGSVTMSGKFSAKEDSPPMLYSLAITPEEGGVRVHYEFRKSGPLKLSRPGVLLHLSGDRKAFSGEERVWADPSRNGAIASFPGGTAKRFLVELDGTRSLELGFAKFAAVDSEGNPNAHLFRLNFLPGDFPEDQTAVGEYTIRFADMPASFPGQVLPSAEPLAIRSVTPSAAQIPVYEKLELDVDLGATYDNPYDPEDVALDAIFTSPSGRQFAVPGFFMVDQERTVQDGVEIITPRGNGSWRVRFAAMEQGRYTWQLSLRDRTGAVTGGEGSFEATAPDARGFVRVSKADPHFFAFDNGEGHYCIGHNLPIYHTSGQLADEAMRKFAAAGENWNRWWMASYGIGIEWESRLGWYRQDNAARVDLVLDWARDLGLYYMMCMDTHQDFRTTGWDRNPFNKANGGPCEKAGEWFTNEEAREFYRKRLRYTVARWGYSPNVLCWEFGNEFQGWADSTEAMQLEWHREMSEHLAAIDPFDHMITTSFWGGTGPEAFWRLPNMDIVQTHCYTNTDDNVAPEIRRYCMDQWTKFDKPHIFGEFGIRSHSSTADKDPEGWGIHNALWAGMASFCAGPPMPWWHESYIEPLDLYFHFTALRNFTQDLPFGTAAWEPLQVESVDYADPNHVPEASDISITPVSVWGKPEHNVFRILPDGSIEGDGRPQQLLHGIGHADLKNPPSFVVHFPSDGQFVVSVNNVSNSGLLRIWVDGEQKAEIDLPCGEGLGKSSVFRPQWTLWETTYDQDFAVDVPAGIHTIRVENFGKDWVRVVAYRFTGCKIIDKPNLLACGMKSDEVAVLWVQNLRSSWFNHAGNGEVGKVDPSVITLSGLPDGEYTMQWWDTWKGNPRGTDQATVENGKLILSMPELETDVALKIRPSRG